MADTLRHTVTSGLFTRERLESTFERTIWPYQLLLVPLNLIACVAYAKKKIASLLGVTIRYNSALVDGSSVHGREVRDTAGSWRAMETVYDFVPGAGGNRYERAADFLAMNLRQAQAARNRLRLVTQMLTHEIIGQRVRHETVRILSLAAGSGRDVIDAMSRAKARGIRVEALLIDLDPEALEYAQTFARRAGVDEQLSIRVGDVWDLPQLAGDYRPHIVEMIGLCEYLEDAEALRLFRTVHEQLSSDGCDGCFITSQNAGGEGFFLRHVANWRMLFRQPDHMRRLLVETGFDQVTAASEPHNIQNVFRAGVKT